ncbi:MAG: ABC transporter ATP-binding protein, partial [Methylococcales bacterium]
LDLAWLSAWLLVVLSIIPLQLLGGWLDAFFALEVSKILKKRLLAGVLQLDLDAVRHQGAGQLLGRVIESQALESLVLNGGFTVLVALIELVFAGAVLASGAGGRMHLLLLMLWVMLTVALSWRYFRQLKTWTLNRLDITQVMIEDMIGHRTRVAQQPASRRNLQEDKMITDYFHHSKVMDDALVPIMGGLSRGWLIVGLIGMAPVFIAGSASTAALAISLGGLLLANRALSGISGGLSALARAGIAWTQVATLFHSAAQPPSPAPFLSSAIRTGQGRQQLIDASDLVFRYRAQGEPVLKSTCLAIFQGERLLIQGSSGSGKSTLASLLIGLRQPESGLLLLNGLDRFTLGDNWHQLATEAPQFHENHILSGSLAFNLLMGRAWPASDQDLKEAEDLCNELGLADLLNRMPSKLLQQVGETGWQLSHGERSRIFLARALLQNAQLTILDESFAALDPATLHKCLQCAFKHAKTLIVIAHP